MKDNIVPAAKARGLTTQCDKKRVLLNFKSGDYAKQNERQYYLVRHIANLQTVMSNTKMKKQLFIGHILTLLLGGFVYISFRQDTLKMFSWFDRVNMLEAISDFRLFTLPLSVYLPNWFLYSLPDGLWLFSYLSLLLIVWDNEISKHNIHWLLLLPSVAILTEIGQLFAIVHGTFDILDLTFYLGGTILPILIFTNSKTIKDKTT
jgi:hypothetical protein